MRPPDLVCIGHLVREMIRFPDRVAGPFLGSPTAYCSVAAARQNTRTGLVTVIGPDMPGALLAPITDTGVDTRGLLVDQVTTASELVYDEQGHKEIRYPHRARPIEPADIPLAYQGCLVAYVCTMDNDVRLADLAEIAAVGQMSAVDLGGYGGVHMSLDSRTAVGSLSRLAEDVAAQFDVVKASDEDIAAIYGDDNHEQAAKRLLGCGPAVVLITRGVRGVHVLTADQQWQVPALPAHVVDTTGGGDTFMAGFLSEYLRGQDPVRSTCWGCATASYVIESTSGVRTDRMPVREQVLDRVIGGYRDFCRF